MYISLITDVQDIHQSCSTLWLPSSLQWEPTTTQALDEISFKNTLHVGKLDRESGSCSGCRTKARDYTSTSWIAVRVRTHWLALFTRCLHFREKRTFYAALSLHVRKNGLIRFTAFILFFYRTSADHAERLYYEFCLLKYLFAELSSNDCRSNSARGCHGLLGQCQGRKCFG